MGCVSAQSTGAHAKASHRHVHGQDRHKMRRGKLPKKAVVVLERTDEEEAALEVAVEEDPRSAATVNTPSR